MPNKPTHYTVKEAARVLGYNPDTVYEMISDGRIKAKRIGSRGRWRISAKIIEELMR